MLFSVVLSIDHPRHPARIVPKNLRRKLRGDVGESEYRYLAKESGDPDDPWKNAMEWKGSAILTRSEFDALYDALGAYDVSSATMGTLGGPLGGIVPDLAVECEPDAYDTAYIVCFRVTPVSRWGMAAADADAAERTWTRLSNAMERTYGRKRNGRYADYENRPMRRHRARQRVASEEGRYFAWRDADALMDADRRRFVRAERKERVAFLKSF